MRSRVRVRLVLIPLLVLVLANLVWYKLDPHLCLRIHSTPDPATFNAAPEPDGTVKALESFSYALPYPLSDDTYARFFGLSNTGDAFEDAVAVSRRVRELYVHGRGSELYPWLPETTIEEATGRPVLCDIYARTAVSALDHIGHVARVVHLDGHVTMEVYDFRGGRWEYVDPNGGIYVSTPDGAIVGLTELGHLIREKLPFTVHQIDNSKDDPHYTLENLPEVNIYTNGYTAYHDGLGTQYRRKSLVYVGSPASLVVFEESNSPPVGGGFWPVLRNNAVALCAMALFWWLVFTRRRAGKRLLGAR